MSPSALEQKVKEHSQQLTKLEALVATFVQSTQAAIIELKNENKALKDEMLAFKDEMRAFKDEMLAFKNEVRVFLLEMKAFKDEMQEFKNEMLAFKDEMREFKNEMRAFKDEMLEFKNEMRAFKRDSQKQWGELANRLGTFAEDIAAPNILRIAREHARNEELVYYAVRIKKKNPEVRGSMREIDALVEYETFVCVNETKISPRKEDIDAFKEFVESGEFQKYFPDYKEKRIIPILASPYLEPSLIQYATKKKVLIFTMGEDTMDIQNPELLPSYFFN